MATVADSFVKDIIEHPDDDTPRLIFADWLEEQGKDGQARILRLKGVTREEIMQAIIAAPDDDALRIAFARWLQEHCAAIEHEVARAEFIKLQCQAAMRGERHQSEQERTLLRTHGTRWLEDMLGTHQIVWRGNDQYHFPEEDAEWTVDEPGCLPGIMMTDFQRGFLNRVGHHTREVAFLLAATRHRSPVTEVSVTPWHEGSFPAAIDSCVDHPSVQSLRLWTNDEFWHMDPSHLRRVVETNLSDLLRRLEVYHQWGSGGQGVEPGYMNALIDPSWEGLRELSLGIGRIDGDQTATLLNAPLASELEVLRLRNNCLTKESETILTRTALTRLRILDLEWCSVSPWTIHRLLISETLPALERLRGPLQQMFHDREMASMMRRQKPFLQSLAKERGITLELEGAEIIESA